jgi:hypothetical protein
MTDRTKLSVMSCRMTRALEAPTAARTASSRARDVVVASMRFARFAHATASTSTTTMATSSKGCDRRLRKVEYPMSPR